MKTRGLSERRLRQQFERAEVLKRTPRGKPIDDTSAFLIAMDGWQDNLLKNLSKPEEQVSVGKSMTIGQALGNPSALAAATTSPKVGVAAPLPPSTSREIVEEFSAPIHGTSLAQDDEPTLRIRRPLSLCIWFRLANALDWLCKPFR